MLVLLIKPAVGGRVFIRWLQRVSLALVFVSSVSLESTAQDYPNQSLKIVVPFAAGGGADVVARLVAQKLSEQIGQAVIIENKGGAGGVLGAAMVAQSPPDGYTPLLGTGSTHGTNSSVYSKLQYDPVRDFAPVALLASAPLLLVSDSSLPAKSVQEFIALARSRAGQLSFGSYGTGSINHLAAELFNSMAGIQATHIPYRGSAPALTDLIGGRIQFMFDSVATSFPLIETGKIRLLGVGSAQRSALVPDQLTVSEAGVSGYDAGVWFGLFAPAATPKPLLDRLNNKLNASLAAPGVKQSFEKVGVEVIGGSADVLAARVQAEMAKWAALVREKNIRVEQ
jgi:tripartite-type tricarboxylate transporter receptor subunit TctC